MSEIRVLVNGAKGRMGSEAVQAVIGADGLELVGETDLGDELSSAIESARAQVVVDFTIPSAAVHNANVILDSGASPVVGTTGFSVEEIEALQEKAAGLGRGGLIAPNFAVGAVLLMKFAQQAAKYFPDVEVIELHHDQKVDAPSGTALKTVELIRESLDQNPEVENTSTFLFTASAFLAMSPTKRSYLAAQGRSSRFATTPFQENLLCPESSLPFAKL